MDAPVSLLLVLGIIFISTFIRGLSGFGNALIAMPLLTLIIGIQQATPLVGLASETIAVIMLAQNWQHVDVRAAWRLLLASLLGIPPGVLLVARAPEGLVTALLGIFLLLFGVYNLLNLRLPALRWPGLVYPVGFLSGILGGAYNTNGPPIIVYGMLARWPPEQFRATLQGYFLCSGVFIVLGHAWQGLWTAQVLWLYVYSLPPLLLAVVLGSRLHLMLPRQQFERLISVLLMMMGLVLIIE
jgi:hypothetical protein